MEDLEGTALWKPMLVVVSHVLLYYAGTRGVLLLTRRHAGRWYRRALVSFSFAALFAPSVIGVGAHGGILPVPAWMAAVESFRHEWWELFWLALGSIGITAIIFFVIASFMSK